MERMLISEELIRPQLLTLREFRPFKTCDEYLWAMKEDLSDWLNTVYPELNITPTTFMESLETGVTLCKHANNVRIASIEWINSGKKLPKCWGKEWKLPNGEVSFNSGARPVSFFARDNVHNFITWCRKLGIFECLLFESDDLILRKNEKSVILCLLEVARRGSHFGMAAPLLIQFEKEIDRDIAKDTGQDLSSSSGEEEESFIEHGPSPQIITNDLRSLDEMVREQLENCTCPTQFPMIRVTEGKYRIGNTKLMIYVRILRNHVMVRVGGGWTTLGSFLQRHDPCRHRTTVSSKFIMKNDGSSPKMKVEYERRDLSFEPIAHSTPSYNNKYNTKKSLDSDSSSEISDEGYKTSDNSKILMETPKLSDTANNGQLNGGNRKPNAVIRGRSLSTDEERPDSRSTDEEVGGGHNCQTLDRHRVGHVVRSSSGHNVTNNNKVPSINSRVTGVGSSVGHGRSASCERPSRGIQVGQFRHRYVSGEEVVTTTTTTTTTTSNNLTAPRTVVRVAPQQTNNLHGHKRTNSAGGGMTKRMPLAANNNNNNSSNSNSNSNSKNKLGISPAPSSPQQQQQRQTQKGAPPTRSLSAGGNVEFYHRNNLHSQNNQQQQHHNIVRGATTVGGRNNVVGGSVGGSSRCSPVAGHYHHHHYNNRSPGKNTWNGTNTTQRRQRPNLFNAQFFGSPDHHQAMRGERPMTINDDDCNDSVNNLSQDGYPNLAEWIKKALELDLDADKISHIELAIKEFEQKREKSQSPEVSSLPYTCNGDISAADSPNQKGGTLPIRKRKENGLTKIPKPNFY